jgi:hypothetical protein
MVVQYKHVSKTYRNVIKPNKPNKHIKTIKRHNLLNTVSKKSKRGGNGIDEEDFFKTVVNLLNSHLLIHRKYPQIYLDDKGNMINIHNEINKLENSSFFEQREFSVFTFLNQYIKVSDKTKQRIILHVIGLNTTPYWNDGEECEIFQNTEVAFIKNILFNHHIVIKDFIGIINGKNTTPLLLAVSSIKPYIVIFLLKYSNNSIINGVVNSDVYNVHNHINDEDESGRTAYDLAIFNFVELAKNIYTEPNTDDFVIKFDDTNFGQQWKEYKQINEFYDVEPVKIPNKNTKPPLTNAEPNAEPTIEQNAEQNAEPTIEQNAEPTIEQNAEPTIEQNAEPIHTNQPQPNGKKNKKKGNKEKGGGIIIQRNKNEITYNQYYTKHKNSLLILITLLRVSGTLYYIDNIGNFDLTDTVTNMVGIHNEFEKLFSELQNKEIKNKIEKNVVVFKKDKTTLNTKFPKMSYFTKPENIKKTIDLKTAKFIVEYGINLIDDVNSNFMGKNNMMDDIILQEHALKYNMNDFKWFKRKRIEKHYSITLVNMEMPI